MKKIRFLSLGLILAFSANLFAQQMQPMPIDPNVRYGQLENGLTYYIRHNEKPKERVEFHIAQNVGAILEKDEQNGLAHFLEHMAFNGTKHFPGKGIINYFERQGVKFGVDINAYTSLDETVYRLSNIPTTNPEVLDSALYVMHDWSSFITLDHQEIDDERGVILEEWRTGNDAGRRMWKKSNELRYPGSQYAKRDVIGDTAVINNFSYDAIKAYYHKWYRPDQQAIIIVGDIDVDEMEAKLKEVFADIPRAENAGERPVYEIEDNVEPIVAIVTDPEASNTQLRIDFKKDKLPKEIESSIVGYVNNLANRIATSVMNERFEEISMQADAPFIASFSYYGELVKSKDAFIAITVPKEGSEIEAFDALVLELEKMKRFGFTVSEVERVKTNILKNLEKNFNERENRENIRYAQEYIRHYLDGSPIPGIETEYEMAKMLMPQLSADVINQAAKTYLTEENIIITVSAPEKESVIVPTKEQLLASLSKAESAELEAKEEEDFDVPLIEKTPKAGKVKKVSRNAEYGTTELLMKNGVRVIIKPTEFKSDEISMNAYSDGGFSKVKDIADLPSAMMATGIVSANGIGKFNATDLSKVLTGKIASVSTEIDKYSEGISGSSSIKDFETMLQLTYLHFTEPRKDDNSYSALISMLKTALANVDKNPNKAFNDSVQMTISSNDPRTILQDLAMLDKIDQDKALAIYKERFANPADFTFIFVGNINPDDKETQKLLATYLGGLKTSKKKEQYDDVYRRMPKGKVDNKFQREMETKTASNFTIYSADIPHSIENQLLVSTIGSILSMRYLESIREKEGGSYGVGVRGRMSRVPNEEAVIMMQFDTDPNKQEHLMGIIHQEIEEIVENGPLAEDLQKVKGNLLKQYEQNIETNSWWSSVVRNYYRYGDNNLRDYKKAVEALEAESIQAMLKKIVEQNNVIEVVMTPN